MMMAQWQRRRYMVYQLIESSKQATGQLSYTVGLGGDFNIARPSKLEFAYFRQNQNTPLPVDYPLQILRAREDFDRISIKNLNAFPMYAFYDGGFPLAKASSRGCLHHSLLASGMASVTRCSARNSCLGMARRRLASIQSAAG
jgi:hypothetical protein